MRSLRQFTGHRVLIQTSEQGIDGTIAAADRESVSVTEASLLSSGDPVRLDGRIWVPDAAIRWVQVV